MTRSGSAAGAEAPKVRMQAASATITFRGTLGPLLTTVHIREKQRYYAVRGVDVT